MKLFALVPCAGVGERAGQGGPKQYAHVAGRSLVAHTLAALGGVERLSGTLVVLSPEDTGFALSAPDFAGWVARVGGDSRAVTVANGLSALRSHGGKDDDWVLVHDATRCLVRAEWIDALIDECVDDEVGGLLGWPLADTLKLAGAMPHSSPASSPSTRRSSDQLRPLNIASSVPRVSVSRTVDRHGMWQAQTPQMFRLGLLERALAAAGPSVTDEAGAVERLGLAPRLVRGAFENFKLTYPPDFDLAERLLASRRSPIDDRISNQDKP